MKASFIMKILIINENRHNSIGGIEKYTNQLIELFTSLNHEVAEYAFNLNPEKIDFFPLNQKAQALNVIPRQNPFSWWKKKQIVKAATKEIASFYDQYDLVINQTANIKWPKKIYQSPKWIYVQHFNPDFYKHKFMFVRWLSPIIYLGMELVGIKNPFQQFQNLIFFSKADAAVLNKKKVQHWIIPLASYSKAEIETNQLMAQNQQKIKNQRMVYFGRIENQQKQIKNLIKLAIKNDWPIDFYGSGQLKHFLKAPDLYKGIVEQEKVAAVLENYSSAILLSRYEGFPFFVVEALSLGVPIIISNFCPASALLAANKGFLAKTKKEQKRINDYWNQLINDPQMFANLQNNCFNFALEHLTIEKWEANWKAVLQHFEKQKTEAH